MRKLLLKQMQYFVSVVECNSFTEAAERNYISQSAISQQIMALESELGIKLLVRENRKFSLTPAGEYFYRKSLGVLDEAEQIKKQVVRIATQEQTEIRAGYLCSSRTKELSEALALFETTYPDIQITLEKGNHEELFRRLQEEQLDFVINDQRRAFSDEFVNFELISAFSGIIINRKNHLSVLDHITAEDLRKLPCILVAAKEQEEIEKEHYRTVYGIGEDVLFAKDLEEAELLVAGNRGYFLAESFHNGQPQNRFLRNVPFYRNGKQITKQYCIFWKKSNDRPIFHEFARVLQEQFIQRAENEHADTSLPSASK